MSRFLASMPKTPVVCSSYHNGTAAVPCPPAEPSAYPHAPPPGPNAQNSDRSAAIPPAELLARATTSGTSTRNGRPNPGLLSVSEIWDSNNTQQSSSSSSSSSSSTGGPAFQATESSTPAPSPSPAWERRQTNTLLQHKGAAKERPVPPAVARKTGSLPGHCLLHSTSRVFIAGSYVDWAGEHRFSWREYCPSIGTGIRHLEKAWTASLARRQACKDVGGGGERKSGQQYCSWSVSTRQAEAARGGRGSVHTTKCSV